MWNPILRRKTIANDLSGVLKAQPQQRSLPINDPGEGEVLLVSIILNSTNGHGSFGLQPLVVTLLDLLPVYYLPDVLHVLCPYVLVVDVVGMLPHVNRCISYHLLSRGVRFYATSVY